MPYNKVDLPEYPVERDAWDIIKSTDRPIVVYGMGNGADKLFDRLASMGVTPTDIFASDGFVSGINYFNVGSFGSDFEFFYITDMQIQRPEQ